MTLYRLTAKAKADLRSIWLYIAADNVEAADRVEEAIYDACLFLAKAPLRRHPRRDLTALPVRFWTMPRYSNMSLSTIRQRSHCRSFGSFMVPGTLVGI